MEFSNSPDASRRTLDRDGWRFEYLAFDVGPKGTAPEKAIIALHGFARPCEDHLVWKEVWPEPRRMISIHLAHHGRSAPRSKSLSEDAALPPDLFLQALQEIAVQEGCHSDGMDLIGYSIGGRIAMSLLVLSPTQWERVVLLAPDGLKKALFYDLTVHTIWGRWLWMTLDRHADRVNGSIHWLSQRKLLPKHLAQFALFHTETHEMRMMVWKGWRAHRLFWPSLKDLARAMESGPADGMHLFFGERDKVIPPSNAMALKKRVNNRLNHVNFHVLPSGHAMLREDAIKQLIQRIFES
jgi:pimeloyl-ACP methyl ester carboxylesterase